MPGITKMKASQRSKNKTKGGILMYLLSIVAAMVVMVGVCVWNLGLNMLSLFDGMTLLFLLLFIVPQLIMGGLFTDFNNAFRLGIGKRKAGTLMELKRAKEAVDLTVKISLVASVFIAVASAVLVLYATQDPLELGPSMAVAITSPVYGVGLALLLLPLQSRLNIRIQEFISEKE